MRLVDTYLVFGRTAYAEPLEHLGALEADSARRARRDSLARFGRRWVELSLVPQADIVWVLREREEDRR